MPMRAGGPQPAGPRHRWCSPRWRGRLSHGRAQCGTHRRTRKTSDPHPSARGTCQGCRCRFGRAAPPVG
eukprot:5874021-Alexandrium_andersonii.AAC.1